MFLSVIIFLLFLFVSIRLYFFLAYIINNSLKENLDPLDPLTEIIKSGQAFSSSIALERILWIMMGFFFLGAISTSIKRGMKQNNWFGNKSFISKLKSFKGEDNFPNKISDEDK